MIFNSKCSSGLSKFQKMVKNIFYTCYEKELKSFDKNKAYI